MAAVLTPPHPAAAGGEVTPKELLRMGSAGKGYELVDGELKERAVSFLSSFVAGRVYRALDRHVEATNAGWLSPEGTGYQCFPDAPRKVRRADVSFLALDRLTADRASAEGFLGVTPDLVVEVNSPNDTVGEVNTKVEEWLGAGVTLVWEVDPEARIVVCHRRDGSVTRRAGDTLTGDPVLPGFAVPVADLFKLPAGAAGERPADAGRPPGGVPVSPPRPG